MVPRFKAKNVSVMVWGAFGGQKRSQLVTFDAGAINSERYIEEVLKLVAILFIREFEGAIFQQDNAPIHNSKKS